MTAVQERTQRVALAVEQQTPANNRPFMLVPTVVVALDEQGAAVAQRVVSLLRAHIRGGTGRAAEAVRERFRFIHLTHDPSDPALTNVQALAVDPSAQMWNIAQSWHVQPLRQQRALSFGTALKQAIRDVLSYPTVEEELRDQHIMVQPSHLNVFFAGALVHQAPPTLEELSAQTSDSDQAGDSDPFTVQLNTLVQERLETIRDITTQVRAYAEESASLDLVVRGAFLSLVLPEDSYEIARDSLQQHGTAFGQLLHHSAGAVRVDSYDYKEPPLHFCAFYTDHDERGAWYEPVQVTNMIASAIYALMQSELLDHGICAMQLGLRDPYAGAYERIVSITATRSSVPRADLLDYAALSYGAQLLERLLPPVSGPLSGAERTQFREDVETWVEYPALLSLIEHDAPLCTPQGLPRQLSAIGANADYPPPELGQLIPEPRVRWWRRWLPQVQLLLDELTRLHQLSDYLDTELVNADNSPLPLPTADGGTFTYDQEPLLREWHRWRQAMDERVNHPSDGEVMRRANRLTNHLEQAVWGDLPKHINLSGTRYAWVALELAGELLSQVQGQMRRRTTPSLPTAAELQQELLQVRQRSIMRAHIGPIVVLTLIFWPLLGYLLLAIRTSPSADLLTTALRRPSLTLTIPWLQTTLSFSMVFLIASGGALLLLLLGLLLRQWQTLRALRSIRSYARLIRRKYALLQYRDEQRIIEQALSDLQDYRRFVSQTIQSALEAARRAAEQLRERATAISDRGFHDVSEYLPMVRGGPLEIYERRVQPQLQDYAVRDLPVLRREAREAHLLINAPVTDDQAAIQQRSDEFITRLVLGNAQVSEQDPQAGLRYLAYHTLQRDLEEVVQQTVTQVIAGRAQDLQQRTHSMVRTGYHATRIGVQHIIPTQQDYLVADVHATGELSDLVETAPVRGLDNETVMYVRIMNGVWPRLFEGAGVTLTDPQGPMP